jgi:hypothetical protein
MELEVGANEDVVECIATNYNSKCCSLEGDGVEVAESVVECWGCG